MPSVELYHGDNLDIFPLIEDESVDTVITDPPYGLEFMGKEWDHGIPGVAYWAECLRVSKPGAMLCAFGGTRTHHRLMCAIEDAGWEIRDVLMWIFGSGFPKGHDCAKAIQGIGRQEFLTGARHSIRTGASYQCGCSDNCRQCGVSLHAETSNGQGAVPLLADAQERSHLFETLPQTLASISHRCTAFCGGLSFHLSKQDYQSRKVSAAWLLLLEVSSCLCQPCFEQLVRGASDDAKHQDGIDWSSIDALSVVSDWETYEILYRILDISPQPYNHYNTEAEQWQGWNVALKPAYEPIILAMKPLPGTFAQNALGYGVAGLAIDKCRVGTNGESTVRTVTTDRALDSTRWRMNDQGGFTGGSTKGRWPANLLLSHAPGCECVGVRKVKGAGWRDKDGAGEPQPDMYGGYAARKRQGHTDPDGTETVEAWNCVPECPVFLLDQSSGELKSGGKNGATYTTDARGYHGVGQRSSPAISDTGGASRFFTRFHYSAKASRAERELGLLGHIPCLKCSELDSVTHINPKTGKEEKCRRNGHPTVKPLDVCRWLCRLTRTPTGGVVLDPFMGSGRIPMAAILEGRDTIGIELERPSFEIAQAGVQWAEEQVLDMVQGELEYA